MINNGDTLFDTELYILDIRHTVGSKPTDFVLGRFCLLYAGACFLLDLFFNSEDGGDILPRNFCLLTDYKSLHPSRTSILILQLPMLNKFTSRKFPRWSAKEKVISWYPWDWRWASIYRDIARGMYCNNSLLLSTPLLNLIKNKSRATKFIEGMGVVSSIQKERLMLVTWGRLRGSIIWRH
jgi:hypothetical protein